MFVIIRNTLMLSLCGDKVGIALGEAFFIDSSKGMKTNLEWVLMSELKEKALLVLIKNSRVLNSLNIH